MNITQNTVPIHVSENESIMENIKYKNKRTGDIAVKHSDMYYVIGTDKIPKRLIEDSGEWELDAPGEEIYAVRRLSDLQVFTIGDIVNTIGYAGYPNKAIKRFFIGSYNVMYIQWDEGKGSNDGCMSINAIEKTKQKEKIHTTYDGKEIYKGDNLPLYVVDDDWVFWDDNSVHKLFIEKWKYFANKEKRDEYIWQNAPFAINYKELDEWFRNGWTLKEFFQSKTYLNKQY